MILASAHGHPASAFNGLFYATAATLIPILFLAIGVQGPLFARVIGAYQAQAHPAAGEERPYRYAAPIYTLAANVLRIGMVTALAAAACGELSALVALYLQRDFAGSGLVVLLSAGFLTIAAGTAPAGAFMNVFSRTRTKYTGQEPAAAKGDQEADHEASAPLPNTEMPAADALRTLRTESTCFTEAFTRRGTQELPSSRALL